MKQLMLLIAVAFFSLTSCVNGQTVNVSTFEKGLSDKVQLLDVRTPEEYQEGHIKNAVLADVNEEAEFQKVTSILDKEKPVYVYCNSGRRSSKAGKMLEKKGFKTVVNLDGGISAWQEAGKPVE